MKNTVTFLWSIIMAVSFITIPFAKAAEVIEKHASKKEILDYAKKTKTSLEKCLQELSEQWKEAEQEHGKALFNQIKDIWYESHAVLINPEEFEAAVNSYCALRFDPIAVYDAINVTNTKQGFDEFSDILLFGYMMFETKTAIFTMHALFSNNLSEEQKQRIRSIFIKHGKDGSMSLEDILYEFMNNSTYETGDICVFLDLEIFCKKLLPTLDVKIKEFEAQIS